MRPEKILASLDAEQRAAVLVPAVTLLIDAAAGAGKTRTVTHRIAYRIANGEISGNQVLALAHSTKAAGEVRDRLLNFGQPGCSDVTARTFHSAAVRQLGYFWNQAGFDGKLTLMSNRYSPVRQLLRDLDKTDPDTALVFDISAEIGWAKSSLISPQNYAVAAVAANRKLSRPPQEVAELFTNYQSWIMRSGQSDFEDLLLRCTQMINSNDGIAEEVRSRYQHLVVDEYQDIDPAQQQLLDAWLGTGIDLTVVGDVRQSIFGFKGADPTLFSQFAGRYRNSQVIQLVRNYRSTEEIVAAANKLAPRHSALLAQNGPGAAVSLTELADESAEATWVAMTIRTFLTAGVSAKEIAVLYRFNAQAGSLEAALGRAGIAYNVGDNDAFFERSEIRSIAESLRSQVREALFEKQRYEERRRKVVAAASAAGEDDTAAHDAYEDMMNGGTDQEGILQHSVLGAGGAFRALAGALNDAGFDELAPPQGAGAVRGRWEAQLALLELARELPNAAQLSADALLAEMETRRAESHHRGTDTVTLTTLHKAKGLEWEVVLLPRWVEGAMPSTYAKTSAQLAEESRLAYVGVTRAKKHLLISRARTRDGKRPTTASRYLTQLGLTAALSVRTPSATRPAARGSSAAAPGRGTCSSCHIDIPPAAAPLGSCGRCLVGEPGRLFAELAAWRTAQAAIRRAPAYTVVTDAVLYALVVKRPKSATALVAISGIGTVKRDKYGKALLAMIGAATT